ncbi:MAG TPA: adenylate/guanylate cyclase domain-containing protein [Candidatus Acidoferrales bacterium]|nr:adenylate/guanylate cyclase domain-containing protein [Candidatus Acidoferrales bacterium]
MDRTVAPLPTGTVTFFFSDIEGSTTRWDTYGTQMQEILRRHDELMRKAIECNRGYVFKTMGDAFCAAFRTVPEAVSAALDAQRSISSADWSAVGGLSVRMAIHVGITDERDGDYFGAAVNRVARLLAVGHGGQVLLSSAAKHLVDEMLPSQTELLELGAHRLKDLSAPEHIFQLRAPDLRLDFPPLRSLGSVPNNLPQYLTPLIGREEELSEIEALVGRSRLVTLIGTGGIGKTRTALQVAADSLRDDGVWFVDLAPVADPMLVPSAIAEVFNIPDEGGTRRIIERVAAALKTRDVLIVLDNCEHVISAAADAADRLLQVCSAVHLLATSREPLGLAGEECYRMPTLPVPPEGEATAEGVMRYAAAALFVTRARAALQSFALTDDNAAIVAGIVRRLEGIALAIELAAPRVKALNVVQLDQRLDERFKLLSGGSRTAHPRQKTLHALIGWSYDLLGDAERSLLRQCAIFRGGWTLEAAEAICMVEQFADSNALDLLGSLVDKSLVVVEAGGDEQRYRLLESTREFALERLSEAMERDDVGARHCRYFADLALRAHETFWHTDADLWTAHVRDDLENYRSAMDWGLTDDGDAVAAATIVSSLRWLWWYTARREGRRQLERASALLSADAPARVRGLLALAETLLDSGSTDVVVRAGKAAGLLANGIDETGRIEALSFQARAYGKGGRFSESLGIFGEALAAARVTRAARLIGKILASAAYWTVASGDRARARAMFDEGSALLRACGDRVHLAALQSNWGELFFADGDPEGALARSREAERIHRGSGMESSLGADLANAAAYLLALERLAEAWVAARESLELMVRANIASYVAFAVGHLAHIAAETLDAQRAARLLGYADATYARAGLSREPTEERGYKRSIALIRAALSEDHIKTLMAEGAMMDQDAAVAEALAVPPPSSSLASQSA